MKHLIVIGGGAAGFFGAITAAEQLGGKAHVTILEKSAQLLGKVRISGGGRCNVTHSCFQPRELTTRYPRGERALIAPFHRFQPQDTVRWFAQHGVQLKTEADGRMFPITDSSETIIQCFLEKARRLGIRIRTNCEVLALSKGQSEFSVELRGGEIIAADAILLATGGTRTASAGKLAQDLEHTLQAPVPSLFTFHFNEPWVHQLAGVSVNKVEAAVPEIKLKDRGPILLTHWGVSGPVILRLSAWGARALAELDYKFSLKINWVPETANITSVLDEMRQKHPAKFVVNHPIGGLPARLWEQLVGQARVEREKRWSSLSKSEQHQLTQQLTQTSLNVSGKSLNKDEFVTCGGVQLSEVDFKTMQSRLCPGLYFAGEVLDVDGITGGYNFQAAWTTGWIAGQSIAEQLSGL
jgi:hypothetical protein